eukprot:scaffold7639_cov258-Pinguiococcus_pyrenoidosus.AAC.6
MEELEAELAKPEQELVELLTLQDATAKLLCAFCFIFMGARAAAKAKSGSWVESLIRTFLTAFGGGTLVPLILGKPPVFLDSDVLFCMTLLAWALTHLTPVGRWVEYNQALRLPLNLGGYIFKAVKCCSTVNTAAKVLSASALYPIPLMGPIVLGVLGSTGGMFLPFDKGLAAVSKGLSVAFEIPLACSAFFHIIVNDQSGFLGTTLRQLTGPVTNETAVLAAVGWFAGTYLTKELLDSSFDPFEASGYTYLFNAVIPARTYCLEEAAAQTAPVGSGRVYEGKVKAHTATEEDLKKSKAE